MLYGVVTKCAVLDLVGSVVGNFSWICVCVCKIKERECVSVGCDGPFEFMVEDDSSLWGYHEKHLTEKLNENVWSKYFKEKPKSTTIF